MIITDQNHDVVTEFDECQSCNLPIKVNDEVGVKTGCCHNCRVSLGEGADYQPQKQTLLGSIMFYATAVFIGYIYSKEILGGSPSIAYVLVAITLPAIIALVIKVLLYKSRVRFSFIFAIRTAVMCLVAYLGHMGS